MEDLINMHYVVSSLVYSLLGVVILLITFWAIEKISPRDLWREIIEKQNIALAIMAGATIMGMAWIIASAIHG
jgi:putative membrane protein